MTAAIPRYVPPQRRSRFRDRGTDEVGDAMAEDQMSSQEQPLLAPSIASSPAPTRESASSKRRTTISIHVTATFYLHPTMDPSLGCNARARLYNLGLRLQRFGVVVLSRCRGCLSVFRWAGWCADGVMRIFDDNNDAQVTLSVGNCHWC